MTVDTRAIVCTGKSHGESQTAWRNGCRHPGAVEAHRRWLAADRPFRLRPPAVDEAGNCIAPKHGTWQAYIKGCRHPEAEAAYSWRAERRKVADRDRRRSEADLQAARELAAERRKVEKLTGGRLAGDPRRAWRGGKMAVGRSALFWITRGMFLNEATMAELMVAAIRLERVRVIDGPTMSRPLTNIEIGERLETDDRQVYRLRCLRERLRSQRTQRRLADARWKAAIVAAAIERGR